MRARIVLLAAVVATPTLASELVKLPPEVTPALRAACEQPVRRHCLGDNPTFDKVKRCVEQKFAKLGMRCQVALASAGLGQ